MLNDPARARLRLVLAHAARYASTRLTGKAELPETYEYDVVRTTLVDALFDAFMGYASAAGAVTKWRNAAGRAVVDGTADAFYRGYEDAGGEETENDDERWLTARQAEQLGHLPDVFEWVKEQRDEETVTEDAIQGRVEAWASALDGAYNEGRLRGAKNKMLTWHLGDTEAHCPTCLRLDGQRHKARWYLDRNYIPRKPDAAMDCGGWNCDCSLEEDDGSEVTI